MFEVPLEVVGDVEYYFDFSIVNITFSNVQLVN